MKWIKSSACNGATSCVQVAWVTPSRCNSGDCVQVAYVKASASAAAGECVEAHLCPDDGQVWVRDSKLGDDSPVLKFSVEEWRMFVATLAAEQLGTYRGPVLLVSHWDGWEMWRDGAPWLSLSFTDAEVDAFAAGVEAGEFTAEALSAVDGSVGDGPARGAETAQAVSGASSVPA